MPAAKRRDTTRTASKTTAVRKTAPKKPAAKKTTLKTTAATKTAPKKPAAKKTTSKTTAATKTAPQLPAGGSARRNPLVPARRSNDSPSLPPLPVIPRGTLLGTHVSSQGGSDAAPPRATEIGATALQLFTKTPNQWKEREIDAAERAAFTAALAAAGNPVTVSHDSYLINLASPDDALRARSLESFRSELRRCHALGIQYLVSHPGNFMDDRSAGIARNAAGITAALQAELGDTILCLETTAGTGTALGATFDELAAIIAAVPSALHHRIGICVDTCHIYSAGYDIVTDFDGVLAEFDRALGLSRLKVWHLNDSKTPFNSHRDRHELIGEGSLGVAPFRRIMTDPRFAQTVRILETPKLDDATATDRLMLNRLLDLTAA
jgi:deoxyribonuclease IV